MNDSPQIVGKGAFMIKSWEDYRKGGGIAPSPQEVARYLKGGNGARLSREDLISRVSQFFLTLRLSAWMKTQEKLLLENKASVIEKRIIML